MAVVDVRNLDGKKVGQVDLGRRRVCGARESARAARDGAALPRFAARGNAQDEREERSQRRGTQAVEAEGHRPRAYWLDSFAALAPRRHGSRTGAAQVWLRLPRKMFLGALRSALSAKFADNKLFVVEDWQLDSHKTKPFRQALTRLDEASRSLLLVDAVENVNLERASRNIEGVKLVRSTAIAAVRLAEPRGIGALERSGGEVEPGIKRNGRAGRRFADRADRKRGQIGKVRGEARREA